MFKNISKEEIVVPATMSQLVLVRDFIEQLGKKYKISPKIINSFKLVVDEACTNIIRHGYQGVKDGKIIIRAIVRRLSVTLVIIDNGRTFDPRQIKNPDLDQYVKIGKKGGLGILMMRRLMDDIQYNITSEGNELRLTKTREAAEEHPILNMYHSMSMRRKFFIITSAALLLITTIAYLTVVPNVSERVREDVFTDLYAIAQDFAKTNYELVREEQDLILAENAKSFQQNRPDLVQQALIADREWNVMAVYPFERELINSKLMINDFKSVQADSEVTIYQAVESGEETYYFVAPVRPQTANIPPIGYAILKVNNALVEQKINAERKRWMIVLGILFVGGMLGIGFLVTQITEPFHRLAEWVRLVARGQVDQAEIDIDARDEIGEIAQAFSEVTSKFREAQATVIEQQRLQKELQVAQEIQQMLLPDDFPAVVGYDITSYYQSAKEVGGDLFDFVEVDEHSIGICVADVSGKGIPGSLVMTMIRTSLRLEARGNKNPADVLSKVNRFVTDDIRKGMFVTMFYVILDSRERVVSFASAGHNPMIVYRGKTKETYYLNPSGFPVGITLPDIRLFDERIQADRIRLHPDDIVVLYTDGVTEAMNANRELYGEERFLNAIRKYGHLDVTEFTKAIKNDIMAFTGGYEQNDDITLVAIKENMASVDLKIQSFKEMFEAIQEVDELTIKKACEVAGISQSTFYKYKKIYEEGGYELLREMLHGYTNLGLRHMSVELKTKMYDIIRRYPHYGPKKISDLLNTEEYGFVEVSPKLIYEELKRAKLNTRQRREMFVKRGGKRRLKPPGTPLLTLEGEVLVGFRSEDKPTAEMPYIPPPVNSNFKSREKFMSARGKTKVSLFEELLKNDKKITKNGESTEKEDSKTKDET